MAEDVRHDSKTNPSTCRKIKYSNRNDTLGSCPTSDHRWSAPQARLLAPPWPLHAAELLGLNDNLIAATGLATPIGPPASVLYSPGVRGRMGLPPAS